MKRFILMVQFLTRIPVPINLKVDTEDFTEGIKYFPIIGIIIGVALFLVGKLVVLKFSFLTSAAISVIAYLYITGGLHMDGLADSADGLFSGRDRDRILEIMKDSRIGSNGALMMVSVILLKIFLLNELELNMAVALLVLPVFSKFNVVFSCKVSKYAREDGMGNFFIGKVSNFNFLFALMSIFIIIWVINYKLIYILPIEILITYILTKYVTNIIGGMTGDTIGALSEVSDVISLFLINGFANYIF